MSENITLESVRAYVAKNPDVLETLILDLEDQPKGAISLMERKQQLLTQKLSEAEAQIQSFVDISRQNQRLFQLCHALIRTLIKPQAFAEAAEGIKTVFEQTLSSTAYHLFIFKTPENPAAVPVGSSFITRDFLSEKLGSLISFEQPVLGVIRPEEAEILFPEQPTSIASCAIVPLITDAPIGVLTLGSQEANNFSRDQDTLFISFIGDLLASLLDYQYFPGQMLEEQSV